MRLNSLNCDMFNPWWPGRFATRFARIDSPESFAIATPVFIARQADSHESLEFPIRANRANRFARITPLRLKPFRSHRRLLGWSSGRARQYFHTFQRGFLPRDASMRALWSSRQNCSHNVSQKLKRIRRFSECQRNILPEFRSREFPS